MSPFLFETNIANTNYSWNNNIEYFLYSRSGSCDEQSNCSAPLGTKSPLITIEHCCNPSLGLTTKARFCKGVGQEWARESHFILLNIVATLALGSRPRQGFAKVWAKNEPGSHISCSWECKRVWGNEPPHSQVSSHLGSWSPKGLSNLQRAIARVKTNWIEEFLISLERSLNLDV
jgi:hypothetical protein